LLKKNDRSYQNILVDKVKKKQKQINISLRERIASGMLIFLIGLFQLTLFSGALLKQIMASLKDLFLAPFYL